MARGSGSVLHGRALERIRTGHSVAGQTTILADWPALGKPLARQFARWDPASQAGRKSPDRQVHMPAAGGFGPSRVKIAGP